MTRLFLICSLLYICFSVVKAQDNSSNLNCSQFQESNFVRYDHSDEKNDYFMVKIYLIDNEFKRCSIYKVTVGNSIYLKSKADYYNDNAIFFTKAGSIESQIIQINQLLKSVIEKNSQFSIKEKKEYLLENEIIIDNTILTKLYYECDYSKAPASLCEEAEVFCGSNAYSFEATWLPPTPPRDGIPAETGPAYGCLTTQPNPTWFFMRAGAPSGDITIDMESIPSYDIDFICWGPFLTPTGACESGLTVPKIVDCSYSGSHTETCNIPNAQVGDF